MSNFKRRKFWVCKSIRVSQQHTRLKAYNLENVPLNSTSSKELNKVKKLQIQDFEICGKQFLQSFIYISLIHLAKSPEKEFKKAVRQISSSHIPTHQSWSEVSSFRHLMRVNVPWQVAIHHINFKQEAVKSEANTEKVKSIGAVLLLASSSSSGKRTGFVQLL